MFMYLCDLGNIVLVVEYDEDVICEVDYIVDIGLGVGVYGGEIIVEGLFEDIKNSEYLFIGKYLFGREKIDIFVMCMLVKDDKWLEFLGVIGNNLKFVDLCIFIGVMICVMGVLGLGKLMLINDIFYKIV